MEHKVVHGLFKENEHQQVLKFFKEGTCLKKIAFMLSTTESVVRAVLKKYFPSLRILRSCPCHTK